MFWKAVTPFLISFSTASLRLSMPGWIRVTPASARSRTCSFFRLDFVSQKTGEGGGDFASSGRRLSK